MKVIAYMRVAKYPGGREHNYKLDAKVNPSPSPLVAGAGFSARNLPTVSFALELDIPDGKFKEAEQVIATIRIPEDQVEIAAEVAEHV